jgi:hypothetical protein
LDSDECDEFVGDGDDGVKYSIDDGDEDGVCEDDCDEDGVGDDDEGRANDA